MPIKQWPGIRNAVHMGQKCVQGDMTSRPETSSKDLEDCLNMNIFAPANPNHGNIQYPVLVYVHGGFFSTGCNAEFSPAYLLERDIVLVVPNYRVDALGKLVILQIIRLIEFKIPFN